MGGTWVATRGPPLPWALLLASAAALPLPARPPRASAVMAQALWRDSEGAYAGGLALVQMARAELTADGRARLSFPQAPADPDGELRGGAGAELGAASAELRQLDAEGRNLIAEDSRLRGENGALREENARLRSESERLRSEETALRSEDAELRREGAARGDAFAHESARLREEEEALRRERAKLGAQEAKLRLALASAMRARGRAADADKALGRGQSRAVLWACTAGLAALLAGLVVLGLRECCWPTEDSDSELEGAGGARGITRKLSGRRSARSDEDHEAEEKLRSLMTGRKRTCCWCSGADKLITITTN